MSWFYNNKRFLRIAILLLLVISLLGPWGYDLLHVPAQYPCQSPVVRLEGDYCGFPISGFQALLMVIGALFSILFEWIQGGGSMRLVEFLGLTFMCIAILPIISTVRSLWKNNSARLPTINRVMWAAACLPALTLFLLQSEREQVAHFMYLLWGIWSFILVAVGAIVLETFIARSNNIERDKDIQQP